MGRKEEGEKFFSVGWKSIVRNNNYRAPNTGNALLDFGIVSLTA
jgi:hypothetical protein